MKEAEKPEVQLTISGGRIDLHLNEPLTERAQRVLRALELGGPPPLDGEFPEAEPRTSRPILGLGSLEARELRGEAPDAQPDEEALVAPLAKALIEVPVKSEGGARIEWEHASPGTRDLGRREARAAIAHLRAQGLMRTKGRDWLADKLAATEEKLEVEQAQVRALTQKCEEANTKVDSAKACVERQRAEIDSLLHDLAEAEKAKVEAELALATSKANHLNTERDWKATSEQLATAARIPNDGRLVTQADWDERFKELAAAHEATRQAELRAHAAGQEAVRIGTELLDEKRRRDDAEKALAMERESLKAAKRRIEALESDGRGSDLQAHGAHQG